MILRKLKSLLCLSATGLACSLVGSSPPRSLPDRDPDLAWRLVHEEHALLLDVRSPEEFAAGHIPGAVNINITELPDRLEGVDKLTKGDKNHPIVVYCRSGRRAAHAKDLLLDHGYLRVTNLGGVTDWPGPLEGANR
ncbi:MAG: hypothetical protein Kow00109_16120 [Acidobacteriota bacterium]